MIKRILASLQVQPYLNGVRLDIFKRFNFMNTYEIKGNREFCLKKCYVICVMPATYKLRLSEICEQENIYFVSGCIKRTKKGGNIIKKTIYMSVQ